MHTFHLPSDIMHRFRAFRDSPEYGVVPSYSKTEYWQHHSSRIQMKAVANALVVSGCSGYYIPPVKRTGLPSIQEIKEYLSPVTRRIRGALGARPQLLSFSEAFDAVMMNRPVAELSFGPQRIDFRKLANHKMAFLSQASIKANFFAKHKYRLNPQMIHAHYIWNVLCATGVDDGVRNILEIGPGNGNLSALLHHYLNASVVCVDLPETLCLSILFIADLFPEAVILMPHEQPAPGTKYDFIFLTPEQIGRLPDDSIDLVVNTCSFQEMTSRQVDVYFKLVQRVCHDGGYFLAQNRVEKFLPVTSAQGAPEYVSRFSDCPWDAQNEVVVFQTCPFYKLTCLDDLFIRLEKIRKKSARKP